MPLAFLIAAVGVLLVAYTFVRLCQYYHHSGSVYAFVGATLGPRTGVVAGWGLAGTYVFYAVTTAAAAGIFGTGLLDSLGIWKNQPSWAPMLFVGVVLALALLLAALPARGGTNVLLIVEVCTVTLILIVTVVVFVKLLSHSAPGRVDVHLVGVQPGARHAGVGAVPRRGVRLPVVRRVRGVGDARRGGAQPDAGTSRGRSSGWRSSAASTSWW